MKPGRFQNRIKPFGFQQKQLSKGTMNPFNEDYSCQESFIKSVPNSLCWISKVFIKLSIKCAKKIFRQLNPTQWTCFFAFPTLRTAYWILLS